MNNNKKSFASDLFFRINENKRDRIISEAVKEFADKGYASANVNYIAKSAGISIGSLYKYFPTKDDLFMYIVETSTIKIETHVTEILNSNIRFLSKIEKIIRLAQDYSKVDPTLIKLYNVFSSESDSKRARIIAENVEGVTAKAYRQLVEDVQKSGEISNDIDPGILAFMFDNQLMTMQFSFACDYYEKRYNLFLGEKNAEDNEYVINNMMKVLERMFGVTNG